MRVRVTPTGAGTERCAAEACGYAGIVVWILAFVGAAANDSTRSSPALEGDRSIVGRPGDDAGLVAATVSCC